MSKQIPITESLQEHLLKHEQFLESSKKDFDLNWNKPITESSNLSNFTLYKVISTGAFGNVYLIHDKREDEWCALKAREKKKIVEMEQIQHVMSEIKVVHAINFPFLTGASYYFKDNCHIFLVSPYIQGVDLVKHLDDNVCLDEELTKFYAAQIVLSLEYLHAMGLIYRELTLENVILGSDGYIKLTDFGFCKKVDGNRTWSLCGTPEYLAPEIILSQGYTRAVDWWSLGILIYEMVAGETPFIDSKVMTLYNLILAGKVAYPQKFSNGLIDLLKNLIQVDRTKRFGMMKSGPTDIKSHPWFKSMDWEGILEKKLLPSYKPQLESADDFSYFDEGEEFKMRANQNEEFAKEFNEIKVEPNASTRNSKLSQN